MRTITVLGIKAWLETMDATYLGDAMQSGVDAAAAIAEDTAALDRAYRLGQALVRGG